MDRPLFALVVGINEYQSESISNLQGCVRDAEAFREALLQYSTDAQICFLTEASATRAEIIRAFEQHLIANPSIAENDPVVVYFACKGRRRTSPEDGFLGRDVDMLIPHDCCEGIAGISDITLDTLLCELAQKKGANITLILDTCFDFMIPRGKIRHRSEIWVAPPTHIPTDRHSDPEHYTGLYGSNPPAYVLLAACGQHQLAYETSDGGEFTQALVAVLHKKLPITYRELVTALELPRQDCFCSGLHEDRLLIPKLRVFVDSTSTKLEIQPDNDFVHASEKVDAHIALRSTLDGGTVIERLDPLIATYSTRDITVTAEHSNCLPFLLNQIARFHYHLYLSPEPKPFPPLMKAYRWVFGNTSCTRVRMELYQLISSEDGFMEPDKKIGNLLKRGVARLDCVGATDRYHGIKISNLSKQNLFPYLFYFDPAAYSVQRIYPPPASEMSIPHLKSGRFFSPSSLTVGYYGDAEPMTFTVEPGQEHLEQDAGFFKLVVCSQITDLGCMLQHSLFPPVQTPISNSKSLQGGHTKMLHINGFWDTTLATVCHGQSIQSK
ncbi:caspase domain-containing protein [Mycena sp. CBHHK59/15]|nr:caspase domain-containing protein [Mycena sp. CBHHK59/15]